MSFISGVAIVDHNITQKAGAPVVTDDIDAGFVVGDIIVDTSASPREGYKCTDNTVGAAVWEKTTTAGEAVRLDNIDSALPAVPDADGGEVLLKGSDGGAHTLNDPDGGPVGFEPGAKGVGGVGADGVFFVRQPGGDNTKQIELSHNGSAAHIFCPSGAMSFATDTSIYVFNRAIIGATDIFKITVTTSASLIGAVGGDLNLLDDGGNVIGFFAGTQWSPQVSDNISLGDITTKRWNGVFSKLAFDVDLATDTVGLLIKANASQTVNLLEIQDSAGAALFTVQSDGNLTDLVGVQIADPTVSEVGLNIFSPLAGWSIGEKISLNLGSNIDPDLGEAFRLSILRTGTATRAFVISHVDAGVETQRFRVEEGGETRIGPTDAIAESALHVQEDILIDDSGGAILELRRKDTSVGAGNKLGDINWSHNDGGTGLIPCRIRGAADLAQGAGDLPGRIEFLTCPDGSTTLTEVFRIDSNQNIVIADGNDIVLNTTTGTKIGTGATEKLGIWDATPIVQPAHIIDADGTLADSTTKFNQHLADTAAIGLQAAA